MNTTQKTKPNVHDFLSPPTEPGDLGTLGSYRIISELGKGGMGAVFRAEDIRLKRTVALKVMNKKIAATPNSRKRFIEEARAMAAVHHDNVVVIFEVGEKNNTPFMAMELLKGKTVEALNTAKTKLEYEQVIDFAEQISKGLAAAHERGIVHRDIKPANIWIEEDTQRVKILDFGLALAQTPVDRLAGAGSVIGTPGYLSPEQARTDPLDDRSDLYSLGVVLYELCTGRLPLSSSNVSGQLVAILAHKPKPIRDLNPEIPEPLAEQIEQLLAKEARDRPRSAKVLAEKWSDVREECHAKSEVAQAISKLQMGLSEVVSKGNAPEVFVEVPAQVPQQPNDPLAIPGVPAVPVGTPLAQTPVAPVQRRTAAAPQATTDWKQFWPFIAVGVFALLLIPTVLFALMSSGSNSSSQTSAYVPPATSSNSPPASSTETNDKPQNAVQNNQNTEPTKVQPKQGNAGQKNPQGNDNGNDVKLAANNQVGSNIKGQNQGARNKKGGQGKGQKNRNKRIETPNPNPSASENKSSPAPPMASELKSPDPPVVAMVPAEVPNTQFIGSEPPMSKDLESPKPQTESRTISTLEGNGADATVQKPKKNDPFGKLPTLTVQTRKSVEIQHAYMRFDLGSLSELKKNVESAFLVLTLVDEGRPKEAVIKLHATDNKLAELWQEDEMPRTMLTWRRSFSDGGLDQITSVGSFTLGQEGTGVGSEVRIGGTELGQFISNSKTQTVNLVISGGASNRALNFHSREATDGNPPRLVVEITK